MKNIFKFIPVAVLIIILGFLFAKRIFKYFFSPTPSDITNGVQLSNNDLSKKVNKDVEVVVENLNIPWDIVFLPNGEMLITERPGNLLKIGRDKKIIKIEGVYHLGEGGLLGIALHPRFNENAFIYLYSTTKENGQILNRIERYKLQGDALIERRIILSGIKGSSNHDGGRIKFGPDGYLYVTTGDAENSNLAQETNSLNGKILKVDDQGKPAPGNPFSNEVYSLGHRNSQGLVWDDKGNLWTTEHGPSGIQTGYDEINLIKKGGNYGWPIIRGDEVRQGLITPIIQSGKNDTWAPSGACFYNGSIFFGGLRGEALYQGKIISDSKIDLVAHFKSQFGRIRSVNLGPDGYFYILTNNHDDRGTPKTGDDKIIKINPEIFFSNI